jgi:AraC-like DNA-binding protein
MASGRKGRHAAQAAAPLLHEGAVPRGMVRVGTMREALACLKERAIDPEAVLAEFGLREAYFLDADNTVPYVVFGMFMRRCAQLARCEHIGLEGGRRMTVSHLGAVGFLCQSAPNLRSGLLQMARYFRFHNPNASLELVEEGEVARWRFTLDVLHMDGREHILDGSMAIAFNTLKRICGPDWAPIEVRLARHAPSDIRPYRQFFGRAVRFEQDDTEIVLHSHWLDTPLRTADGQLHEAMRKRLAELERASPEGATVQLRRMLPPLISARTASLEVVARLLGLSPRTLARRLAVEGTTYMRLREEARHAAACQLLETTSLPANEISDRLGYANPSAFTRAFQRWAGKGPADWRAARKVASHPTMRSAQRRGAAGRA